ncbi:Uncharacterised protein [Raoultella ornithinolytica]|nr:Uncharacterised protein [Raoultella ornithinolytica]
MIFPDKADASLNELFLFHFPWAITIRQAISEAILLHWSVLPEAILKRSSLLWEKKNPMQGGYHEQPGGPGQFIDALGPENPTISSPVWLTTSPAKALITLTLVGCWNGKKEGDKYCIETIAQKDYEELEQELREISLRDDSPVLQIGDVWKAKSPIELLYQLAPPANRKSARTFLLGCKTKRCLNLIRPWSLKTKIAGWHLSMEKFVQNQILF